MNPFLRQISEIKRLVRIRKATRIVLVAVVIFLIIHALMSGPDKLGVSFFRVEYPGYAMAALSSVVLAILISLLRRESFMDVLIDLDSRLKLKERISTAYEYSLLNRKSAFDELLFSDAEKSLRSMNKRKIFPFRFSLIHLSVVILILINLLILPVDYLPAVPRQDRIDPGTLKEIHELIEQYSPEKKNIQKREGRKKRDDIERKYEDIAEKMKEGDVLRQRMDASIQETLQEIEGEKTSLSQDLTSKVETEDVEPVPVLKKREMQRLAVYNLEKLEEMLQGMFDNQIPDSIGEDLALLKEYSELEELLESILNRMNIEEEDTDHAETSGPEKNGSPSGDQNGREPEPGSGPGEQGERQGKSSLNQEDRKAESGGSDSGEGDNGEEAEKEDGDVSKKGESSTAGKGKSDDRRTAPHEIQKSAGPALQDQTVPSSGEGHILRIRSSEAAGEARMKKEDIIKMYQKEMESVIQKEDIPLNYREYIKNYFLSIHMRKEEDAP